MTRSIPVLLSLAILILFTPGCDDHAHDHRGGSTTAPTDSHGHSHDHGHDHGGAKEVLGRVDAGGYEVVAVQNGKLAPGGEVNFDVEILGPSKPTAVQFWLGPEDASVATKKTADKVEQSVYHVDLDVPANLPPGARLWVDVQPASGSPVRVSFDVKR
jgi:hypothetical protein